MNTTGVIILAVFFLCIGLAGYFYLRFHIKLGRARIAEQRKAEHIALRCNSAYAQVEERDRQYSLAQERLDLERQRLTMEREKHTVELALLQARFQLDQHLALTRVSPETYLLNTEPTIITPLPSLRIREREKEQQPEYILAPRHSQPTHEQLVNIITPNSYTYCPGIHAETGEPVIVDLIKVPHLKLIGSTGFGKSCLCGSIIDQLTTTHDPRRLQIALLDLEHKTSRLYEHLPHVATITVNNGKREVRMIATSADQVAEYLGYLYQHMKYREALPPADLYKLPIMLIYIEELLALTHEVVDSKLLQIIFQSLLLLAVRARKYGMFLLAAMQTDYSTEEMKVNQKMFRFRGAAGVDPPAARAAGFTNNELIKQNFQHGKPGQFVIEFPGFSHIILTPVYDVEAKLAEKFGYIPGFGQTPLPETPPEISELKPSRNSPETALKNTETARDERFQEVRELKEKGWGKVKTIEKVYQAKPGESKKYFEAEVEYLEFLTIIASEERIEVSPMPPH